MSLRAFPLASLALIAGLSACSDGASQTPPAKPAAPPAAPGAPTPPPVPSPGPAAALDAPPAPSGQGGAAPQVAQINDAQLPAAAPPAAGDHPAPDPGLIKAQVLLARVNFSPAEIDGLYGSNFKHAVAAYAGANGLGGDGELTPEVWNHLTAGHPQPVAGTYTLTEADVSGPWSPDTHDSISKDKGLPALGFTDSTELLGEKFHMSQELLRALNPGVDFTKAGQRITVAEVGPLSLPQVDHIQVDKAKAQVRAYGDDGKLVGMFPATVGSRERPSPSGVHKVDVIKQDPLYTYDPRKLTWGPKKLGRFTIKAGPNNPVGIVWMGLNAPGYGLHGTPEPHEIGKTASHGCVRMTNWDAQLLSHSVKLGTQVAFLHSRGSKS